MATINDITNAASYRGTPHLGGSLGVGITIDNTPLQRLATFTYYRDRDLWQKRQQQDAMAAKMIADIAAFDPNSPFKQYRDDLLRETNELQNELRKDPSILTYDRNNPQKWIDLQQRIGRIQNKRVRATANDALYNADKARIELITDQAQRDLEKRELDDRANELFTGGIDNAYSQQFESSAPIKQSDYEIPSVAITQSSFIIEEPNKDFIVEVTHGDPADLMAKAQILAAGVPEDIREKDWFKKLSPTRQKLALERNELTASKRRAFQTLSLQYKKSLEEWKAEHKDIDINTVDVNTLPDGIIEDNIRAVKLVNQQIDELNKYVVEGRIKDKAGAVKTTPYAKINFADGLDEAELIVMESMQRNKNTLITKVTKEIKPTDDAIQRRGQDLDLLNARESRALQFGAGADDLLVGNALNDIEIPVNMKPGVYNMTPAGNKQSLANIQRLLGSTELTDDDGKIIKTPILSKEDIESNDKSKAISYEVENINGQPYVTKLQINNIWYDRGYFRNSQLNLDKEPKGGQKTSYRQSQSYLGGKQPKVETDAEYYKRTGKFRTK